MPGIESHNRKQAGHVYQGDVSIYLRMMEIKHIDGREKERGDHGNANED